MQQQRRSSLLAPRCRSLCNVFTCLRVFPAANGRDAPKFCFFQRETLRTVRNKWNLFLCCLLRVPPSISHLPSPILLCVNKEFMSKPGDICEKHGLKELLNHVLSPEYQVKTFPNYVPLRSGHDLGPYGRDDLYVEGAGKLWQEVEDDAVERIVKDVMANGRGKVGGELLDTRMLGEEATTRVARVPSAPKASTAGMKIKLKIKK